MAVYLLTRFHGLVTFTTWDIAQLVYCNYFLYISFETDLSFLIKLVFLPYDQKSGQEFKDLKNDKNF